MPVSEQSQLWLAMLFFIICSLTATWFFVQGYVNIKTGKVSQFGLDAFFRFLDIRYWAKHKNPNWDNPNRLRLTGIMAIAIAVSLARASIHIFNNFILPNLK